ncbi:MAG: 4Fe-4S dicluster domain-containing protein [Planctomycetes bacterium]|nr:4Fe-4S dicluster domain-containing protein [Planctomycetota bacterium]
MGKQSEINTKKGSFAYKTRLVVQGILFAVFLFLLIFSDPIAETDRSVNFFLRSSPLSAIGAMVAAREFISAYWPAIIILIATFFLGRFFCGWICPLGTTLDVTDKIFASQRNKISNKIYDGKRLKYYLLAFLLLSLFISCQMVGWFDPLSIATNAYTIVIHPYCVSLINALFNFLHDFPFISFVSDRIHGFLKEILFALHTPFFRGHFIFLVLFTAIVSLGLFYKRYWCRNLCPLGALFSLLSDWSLFKRVVGENICDGCNSCNVECKMGAIDVTGKTTQDGECILCMRCQDICHTGAIRFTPRQPAEQAIPVDLTRRGLFTACVGSIISAPLLSLNFHKKKGGGDLGIIRPPGAQPENSFLAKCTRCGECMRVCKTNGLHPTILEADLSGMWTPQLIPRIGYCEYDCVLCTRVCPSGAISKLSKETKQKLAIGKARINRNRCIPWVAYAGLPELEKNWKDMNCGVCEEVCPVPTKAIHFNTYHHEDGKEIRRVFVREDVCIGCGFCEKVCPVSGQAAIVVEGIQPQVKIRRIDLVEDGLLPETISPWNRDGKPDVYIGSRKLFEYINGGAEAYLAYSFIRVLTAKYRIKSPEKSIKIDIWEFENSDDAFGVFSRDKAGDVVEIGSRASLFENYLWMWHGKYFVSIEPYTDNVTQDDVTSFGVSVVKILPPGNFQEPDIIRLIVTEEGYREGSIRFFHEKVNLDNIYIADTFMKENILNLGNDTDAVVAEFDSGNSRMPYKILIIHYSDKATARTAYDNLIALKESWGEKRVEDPTIFDTFNDSKGRFSTITCLNGFVVSTFLVPTHKLSVSFIDKIVLKLETFEM